MKLEHKIGVLVAGVASSFAVAAEIGMPGVADLVFGWWIGWAVVMVADYAIRRRHEKRHVEVLNG